MFSCEVAKNFTMQNLHDKNTLTLFYMHHSNTHSLSFSLSISHSLFLYISINLSLSLFLSNSLSLSLFLSFYLTLSFCLNMMILIFLIKTFLYFYTLFSSIFHRKESWYTNIVISFCYF